MKNCAHCEETTTGRTFQHRNHTDMSIERLGWSCAPAKAPSIVRIGCRSNQRMLASDIKIARLSEMKSIGLGPDGKRRQGIVRGERRLGGSGYCARRLIRPAPSDLL